MKKIFVLVSCLLLLSCNQNLHEGANSYNGVNNYIDDDCSNTPYKLVWDYPVKPGMEEWKRFQTNEEMVKACQIPDKVLSSLSTKELTEICLQYPLLSSVFAFNQLNMGADKLFNDFNGIRELFKRKDASKGLLQHYNCLMQGFEDEKSFLQVWNLEFLLGFYTQKTDILSKEDCKEMLQDLLYGHEKEIVYYDPNFSYPYPYNFYGRVQIILKISPQSLEKIPGKELNGVFNGWIDKETMDIINELSYQLIK